MVSLNPVGRTGNNLRRICAGRQILACSRACRPIALSPEAAVPPYDRGMQDLPDRRLTPRESAALAASLFGRDLVVDWAEELLAGRASSDDSRYPDIAWLRGSLGQTDHWSGRRDLE